MKILMMILAMSFLGCSYEKEIQVERAIVELEQLDVLYRQGVEVGCKLTFYDIRTKIPYTLFVYAPEYCDDYLLGVKYKILIRR